jgi:hypothetical protein
VYCAVFRDHDELKLEIWYLDETNDQINWMLKCDVDLRPVLANFSKEHRSSPSNVQRSNCEKMIEAALKMCPNGALSNTLYLDFIRTKRLSSFIQHSKG